MREENPINKNQSKNLIIWFTGIIYFIVIPLILTIVFLISDSLKGALLLYPNNPTLINIIGSNYLHITFPHFISNLIMYLVVMAFIFSFDRVTNERMLIVNIPLFFIVLPIASSLLSVLVFSNLGDNIPNKGFSAIVAGVFGYLAFSTLNYIFKHYEVKFEKSILQLMWLILYINLTIISWVYRYNLVVVIILFLIVLTLVYTRKDIKKIKDLLLKLKKPARVMIFTSLYLCCFVGVISLFPGNLNYNGNLVNILAHYFGYLFGFMVPAFVSIYVIEREKNRFINK